jgi:hypothetical protein
MLLIFATVLMLRCISKFRVSIQCATNRFYFVLCLYFLAITLELSGRARGTVGTIVETGTGELSAAATGYVIIFN